jgi:hypothetical protein
MTHSLLLQMKIFMFGQALLGITLVRLLDLRAQPVLQALDKQALLELLVQLVQLARQAQTELLELMARQAQPVLQALDKQELLAQLVQLEILE